MAQWILKCNTVIRSIRSETYSNGTEVSKLFCPRATKAIKQQFEA